MIRVTLTNELGLLWATPEEFAAMTDEQVWDMIREDLSEFADGCECTIEREPEVRP